MMIPRGQRIIGAACAFLIHGIVFHASTSASYEIFPTVLDAAGGSAVSADYALASATGQAAGVGNAASSDYEAWYGFIPMLGEALDALVVTAPNGGESWPCGTTQAITWQCNDLVAAGPEVRIGLHKGAVFLDWIVRRTANDGAYNWIVWTDLDAGDDYHIRVQSYTDAGVNDYSDAYFSITPLGLLCPNGGEQWQMGSVHLITWASNPDAVGADVRLGLHHGASFVDWIVRQTENDGSYYWKLPTDIAADTLYAVRVQSYSDSAIRDLSDLPFEITQASLLITGIELGMVWPRMQTQTITWVSNSADVGDYVRIGLHKGGAFVDWLIRRTANNGSWDWYVPGNIEAGYGYRLRLQSFTDRYCRNMSPAFTITEP